MKLLIFPHQFAFRGKHGIIEQVYKIAPEVKKHTREQINASFNDILLKNVIFKIRKVPSIEAQRATKRKSGLRVRTHALLSFQIWLCGCTSIPVSDKISSLWEITSYSLSLQAGAP